MERKACLALADKPPVAGLDRADSFGLFVGVQEQLIAFQDKLPEDRGELRQELHVRNAGDRFRLVAGEFVPLPDPQEFARLADEQDFRSFSSNAPGRGAGPSPPG